jgi:hypothetical protein
VNAEGRDREVAEDHDLTVEDDGDDEDDEASGRRT